MASRSHNALPVLEEWYYGAVSGQRPLNRPRMCGVAGCAEPLVKSYHLKARLCAAHMTCPAVLHRGVPQRWCGNCQVFHMLEAYSGSQRYAPASRLQRALFHPKIPTHITQQASQTAMWNGVTLHSTQRNLLHARCLSVHARSRMIHGRRACSVAGAA